MLNIFQKFVTEQNYSYLKLEGGTSIGSRQPIINKFNKVTSFFNIYFLNRFNVIYIIFLGPVNFCNDFNHKGWWLRC
jgi:DNA excision repair protein ERCC-6